MGSVSPPGPPCLGIVQGWGECAFSLTHSLIITQACSSISHPGVSCPVHAHAHIHTHTLTHALACSQIPTATFTLTIHMSPYTQSHLTPIPFMLTYVDSINSAHTLLNILHISIPCTHISYIQNQTYTHSQSPDHGKTSHRPTFPHSLHPSPF